YVFRAAAIAARAGDSSAALLLLKRYAALRIGGAIADDSNFRSLRGNPDFRTLATGLEREARLARSTLALTVDDPTFHPEGLAFDSRSRRWFVSSVKHRRIVAVDSLGVAHQFVRDTPEAALGAVFGMAVDSVRGLLWAATTDLARMDGFREED